MRKILKAKLTYFYVAQIVSDNLHLKCYEICLKTTNGPTPPPSRTKRSVPGRLEVSFRANAQDWC